MRAFGMDIRTDFAIAGVEFDAPGGDRHPLSLREATPAEVRRGFPKRAERIGEVRLANGSLAVSIDAGGGAGYLAWAADSGQARVAADGQEVLVAPMTDVSPWLWQRFLTGQVLPLAALLQGLEVFHSSVLGLEGRAIAVVGASGVGKTTLALRLVLQGLDFMSDDVLVVEPGERPLAHPGIGVADVRPGAEELVQALEQLGLATAIGENDLQVRLSIRCADSPLPLTDLFVVTRSGEPGELRVERLRPVDPLLLLAATFNLSLRTPERLARQLDVCSQLERSVSIFELSAGIDVPPDRMTEAILEHAAHPLPC